MNTVFFAIIDEIYFSEEEWTADGKAGRPNATSETTGNGKLS